MRTLTVVLYGMASPGLGACCTSSASIPASRQAGSSGTPSRRIVPLRFPATSVETFGAGPFCCAFPLTALRQSRRIETKMNWHMCRAFSTWRTRDDARATRPTFTFSRAQPSKVVTQDLEARTAQTHVVLDSRDGVATYSATGKVRVILLWPFSDWLSTSYVFLQ